LSTPERREIAGFQVHPVVQGAAGAWAFGFDGERDDDAAVGVIHSALDCGLTMFDTARVYTRADHPGYSEAIIAQALATHPDGRSVVITTKGGSYRDGAEFKADARPDALRRHCELSLELLQLESIDLYQLHGPDPAVPYRDSITALARLRDEGLIRHIGVNSLTVEQLREAMDCAPIASVQNAFGPFEQRHRPLFDHCRDLGLPFLAFSVLRGVDEGPLAGRSLSAAFPLAHAVARERGVSIERLALAWVLALAPTALVITGASRPETIRDSALAAGLELTADELGRLDFGR
jgi:aryl-alcohol dehydrogenase-like predicted oxidoreductase